MNSTFNEIMLALINPAVLPALRTAATFFLIINLIGGTYIFRNRHRFFDGDPNVDNDIDRYCRVIFPVIFGIASIATFAHRAADPNEGFVLRSARHGPCEQSYVSAPKRQAQKNSKFLKCRPAKA